MHPYGMVKKEEEEISGGGGGGADVGAQAHGRSEPACQSLSSSQPESSFAAVECHAACPLSRPAEIVGVTSAPDAQLDASVDAAPPPAEPTDLSASDRAAPTSPEKPPPDSSTIHAYGMLMPGGAVLGGAADSVIGAGPAPAIAANDPGAVQAALSAATVAALTGGVPTSGASSASSTPVVQQKDTTWTKLFVGGLPYHTTDKSLREHFAVYGDIEEAVVITDRQTGKSRGYGFVIMGDRSAAERACKDPNPIIDGRKANVNLAILGAKPRGNVTPGDPPGFSFAGLRAGYQAVIPGQFGLPQGYVYPNPYMAAAPGMVSLQPNQISHLTAAAAAASNPFYTAEYQPAAFPGQYANGLDPYAYTSAAGAAASYVTPYTYATLPQGLPTGSFPGISPYQAQTAQLQEARLQ